MTKQRAKVVDFSDVFLTVYATILVQRRSTTTTGHGEDELHAPIRSIKDLVNQSEVRYGTLNKGVLVRAFKRTNVTLYKMMWRQMQRFDPSVFTATNEEGIERLRRRPQGDYAFILPHTIAEYVSLRDPCDLVTVGRFLMHRGYALAVRRESPLLRRQLNDALRRLAGTGYMDGLYRKWWFGRSDCDGGAMIPRSQKVYSVRNRAAVDPPPSMATAAGGATSQRHTEQWISVFLFCPRLLLFLCGALLNGRH